MASTQEGAPTRSHLTRHGVVWVLGVQFEHAVESLGEQKSGGLLGGYKEVSGSDGEVQEAASFAAEQLSQRSNSLLAFKLKEVRGTKPCRHGPAVHQAQAPILAWPGCTMGLPVAGWALLHSASLPLC